MMDLLNKVKSTLQKDERLVSEDGELLKSKIIELTYKLDKDLITLLLKDGDPKYIGVADNKLVKLFSQPPFEKIISFAKSFDPQLVFAPSQVDKPELNDQAEKILGKPDKSIKLEFST